MTFFVPRPRPPCHHCLDLHTHVQLQRTWMWSHARAPTPCVRATKHTHVPSVRARMQRRDASDRDDARTDTWDLRLSRALQVARVVDDDEEEEGGGGDAPGPPSHVHTSLPARQDAWTRALVALRTVASAGAEWEMAMDAVERAELLDETLLEAARARLEVESSRRDPERTRAFELLVRAIAARYARKEATRSMKLLDELMRKSPKEAAKKLKRALMDEAWDREDVPAHWEHADVFRIASETARKARQNPKPSAQPREDVVKIPPREFVGEVQTLWDSLDPEQKQTDAGIKVMKILHAARAVLERMEEEGMEMEEAS